MSHAGKARDRRQPLRGLRVVDVPALGRVGEDEMVLDEELDGRRVIGVQVQAAHHGLDERHALRGVAVPERLADVVQQDPQHEELGPLHLGEDLRQLVRLGTLPGAEPLQHLHREERMLVDGEAVVVVVLDQTVERAELGQVGAEHARCRASAGAWSPRGPTSGGSTGTAPSARATRARPGPRASGRPPRAPARARRRARTRAAGRARRRAGCARGPPGARRAPPGGAARRRPPGRRRAPPAGRGGRPCRAARAPPGSGRSGARRCGGSCGRGGSSRA